MRCGGQGQGARWVLGLFGAVWSFALAAGPALAHHPMGGKTPSTFLEGLLSGIGHPVIGPDHLAFIVAIGIAAAMVPSGIAVIAAFIAASSAGVIAHALALDLPFSEALVATSVVLAGGLIAFGRGGSQPLWLALAAVAGLCHGYAFGEAIVGAQPGVIGAYLIGIAIIASVIALALKEVTGRMLVVGKADTPHLRTAGAILGCIGVVMLAGSLAG